jgi:septum formation protein
MRFPRIVLASSSPRRRQLLQQIGVEFDVIHPDADESLRPGEPPIDMVQRLAREKAETIATHHPDRIVLGSDTTVVLEEEILGKPDDPEHAVAILRQLSGNTHTVYTGYSLVDGRSGRTITGYDQAQVTFRPLSEEEIRRYVATGSPLDKAGAYGIQDDYGAVFIEKICGDYYTIVGLPITKVYLALRELTDESI